MLLGIVLFTSCSSDDEPANGLSGWYSTQPESGSWGGYTERRKVYNFKNENTVVLYETVLSGSYWTYSDPIPGHSGWYHQSGIEYYETYVVNGNKIIITNGDILTIEENGDVLRSGSWKYTRW